MATKPLDRQCPTCRRWIPPAELARHEARHAAAAVNRANHWRTPASNPQPRPIGFVAPPLVRKEDTMAQLTDAQRASLEMIRAKERQDEADKKAKAAARFAAYQAATPAARAQAQHRRKPQEEAA